MWPMNPPGDPRSHHRWSVWRPMDSLGFAETISEWNWTYDSLISCVHFSPITCCQGPELCTCAWVKRRFWLPPFDHFNWFHALSRLLIDGPPRTETDHPTINHGWSVVRPKILHFPQHCIPLPHGGAMGPSCENLGKIMGYKEYRASIHWAVRCLTTKSREVSKPRDWMS